MSLSFTFAFMLIFVGGFAIALQAPINNALGAQIDSGIFAAMISFGVGFTALLILNVFLGNVAPISRLATTPIWMFTGGFLGAYVVYAALTSIGKLGSLTMVATLVFGQLLAALVIDAIGFGNLQVQEISIPRVMAILMIGAGIMFSRY